MSIASILLELPARVGGRAARRRAGRSGWADFVRLYDTLMAVLALPAAVFLTYGAFAAPAGIVDAYRLALPLSALLFLVTATVLRIHLGVWRYASAHDMLAIARAATFSVAATFALLAFTGHAQGVPWSLPVNHWVALVLMLGGSRMACRMLRDWRRHPPARRARGPRQPHRVLIAGSEDAASLLIRALAAQREATLRPVGILVPGRTSRGRRILGVPVLGRIDEVGAIVAAQRAEGSTIDRLVMTGAQPHERVAALLEAANTLNVGLFRTPDPLELRHADLEPTAIRPIRLEDLLGRPQILVNLKAIVELLAGRRILVTGAGGSIGSELVRQIAANRPSELAILDSSEFNLYTIDRELEEKFPDLCRWALLCDVRQRDQVMAIFAKHRPELVFHTAALKHVPMVELNPTEGVLTNVVGTRNVADAAKLHAACAMVQVSTDKAVNPTSMMGASKRLAELYCQALDTASLDSAMATTGHKHCHFITVRFGNVLGSSGSVVPLFQAQLARRGPLTVTHPEIERYFMTIREAVSLILHASAHSVAHDQERGRILVLDMGRPVRIVDLARQIIRLAGLEPDKDVAIRFVGLRPGEKLYEELFDVREERLPSSVEGVLVANSRPIDLPFLNRAIGAVAAACVRRDADAIRAAIQRVVPGYAPAVASPVAAPAPAPTPTLGPVLAPVAEIVAMAVPQPAGERLALSAGH